MRTRRCACAADHRSRALDALASAEARRRSSATPWRCSRPRRPACRRRSSRRAGVAADAVSTARARRASSAFARTASIAIHSTPSSLRLAAADPARRLTAEQAEAFARLRALAESRRFHVALLHGVTGSGKTEIYLRLSAAVRESGRSVLMLVPEIALTPVMASLFRETFGERVADPAQRALRRRAARPVAAHPPRRHRRRRRHAVGGVRAARARRPDHRRRGARRVVQAGGEPALPRPRRGHRARTAGQRAGRARVGDAVDGELLQREHRTLRARRARAARARSAAGGGDRRRHARGVRGSRSRRGAEPRARARRWPCGSSGASRRWCC